MKRLTKKKLSPSMIFYAAARSSSNSITRYGSVKCRLSRNSLRIRRNGLRWRKYEARCSIWVWPSKTLDTATNCEICAIWPVFRFTKAAIPRSVAKKVLKAQILIRKSIQGNNYDKIPGHLKYSRFSI